MVRQWKFRRWNRQEEKRDHHHHHLLQDVLLLDHPECRIFRQSHFPSWSSFSLTWKIHFLELIFWVEIWIEYDAPWETSVVEYDSNLPSQIEFLHVIISIDVSMNKACNVTSTFLKDVVIHSQCWVPQRIRLNERVNRNFVKKLQFSNFFSQKMVTYLHYDTL